MEEALKKIKNHLDDMAAKDAAFAEKYANPKKSLKECWDYIWSCAAKASRRTSCCIDDDIVYGWAVHYYDEEKVEIKERAPKKTGMQKALGNLDYARKGEAYKLSDDDIQEARKRALEAETERQQQIIREQQEKAEKAAKKREEEKRRKAEERIKAEGPTLFDLE